MSSQLKSMSGKGRSRGRIHPMNAELKDTLGQKRSVDDPMAGGDIPGLPSIAVSVYNTGLGDEEPIKELTKSLDTKVSLNNMFTEKPAKTGSIGRQIDVIANHFKLSLKDMTYYHYDIDIEFGAIEAMDDRFVAFDEKKMRKMAQKENIEIIEKLVKEWPQVFGQKPFVFDGLKNLYTKDLLPLNGQQLDRTVSISLDGSTERVFKVWIQFTNEIKMSSINNFFNNKQEVIPEDSFHVLEIILRYKPTANGIPVGRSLYKSGQNTAIGENAVMSYGHYQSVHLTEVGPTLVIDRTATLFRSSGPMTQFLLGLMPNIRHKDISRITFDENLITRLSKQLSGLRVATEHTGGRRHAVIDCLSFLRPNECDFEISKNGTKSRTNVLQYFRNQYNIELKYPDIPCVKLKGGIARYLPIEVCEVVADQPILRKHITPSMTASIVRRSGQQKPTERFRFVENTAEMIASEGKDLLDVMGIKLSTKPIGLKARVLDKPNILGTDGKVFEPKDLKYWSLVCMSSKVRDQLNGKVQEFINNLIREGLKMGLNISPPMLKKYCSERDEKTVEDVFIKVQERIPNLQLVMFCIPYGDGTYHTIKHLADIKYGVMTQCIKADHLLDTPRGFLNNFLLKINGKLNGKNAIIKESERPDYMTGLMIIGVDVTHPAPADRMMSSVAAAIASYDEDFTKFSASIRVQRKNKDEIITELKEMIVELLEQFMTFNNNNRPKGLLVLRDGVSEGQFAQVLQSEYEQLKRACLQIDPQYRPKITFVIVQKRHHTRFVPQNPSDAIGRAGNIPPGTVIDTTIVDPILFEYYLCSHSGIIGTSRPSKYVVLHDDHNLSFDELEKLSYLLCHTYVRTGKPISVPTPVMYSHLAAKRAKDHMIARNRQLVNDIHFHNGVQHREESEKRIAKDLNEEIKVDNKLRNLLYYC